jgi:hypothetical protein
MSEPRPELIHRVLRERDIVRSLYGDRFTLQRDTDGTLWWQGHVFVEGDLLPLNAIYPASYPAVPPLVATQQFPGLACPHVLGRTPWGWSLCWIAASATRENSRWRPTRHTAATAIAAGQRWLLAWRVFCTIGHWPVRDAFRGSVLAISFPDDPGDVW